MILAMVLLIALLFLGVPVALTMGIAPIAALIERRIPLTGVPASVFEMLDSFALLAVLFFVLAGRMMQSAGVARRLVDLAVALTGWMRGGLASAAVLTTMVFSTMSGSSSATTAAMGGVMTPEMVKGKYPRPFVAALLATSGELGAIIPPSVALILYAVVVPGVSVSHLFIGGILPGLLIGVSLIVTSLIVSALKGYGEVSRVAFGAWLRGVWHAFRRAVLSLLAPVIVLGGIYGGFFTPTEASVVAVAYTLFLGLFVYRELKLAELPKMLADAAIITGVVLLIAAFAAVLGYILALFQVPQQLTRLVVSVSDNPIIFLMIVNVILLIAGTALEPIAAIIILAPVLAPVAVAFGVHPVQFAMIMNLNLAIGMITPPTAVNLFIMCSIANVTLEQMIRPLMVFFAVTIFDLLLITYVPWFSLALL